MAELFSGYLKSNGKTPIESIKNGVYHKEPPEHHDYVGILKPQYIQLDFDDKESAELTLKIVKKYKLKCDVLETSRGYHFYFINDKFTKSQSVGIYNAMGVKCDIGLGNKFRAVPLRTTKQIRKATNVNGVETYVNESVTTTRQWLQVYDELDVIPPYFRPLSKMDKRFNDSTSRNQTLFEYILTLQFNGFTKPEVRQTIKMVNEYMLYEPLSDKELDIITRDEAFSEELFYDKKKFLHHRFGDYMLANSNILMIDNQAHIYGTNQLYSNDPLDFERVMIKKIPSLQDNKRKEVYKYIVLKTDRKGKFAPYKYVGLKNSILNIETDELLDYTPSLVMSNKIDYSYNPHAYSLLLDQTLDKVTCHDRKLRMLLEEMIGYSLLRANTMQSCFILTGGGANGKSTILNLIKKLLGKSNYTSLDLRELEETFKPSEMYNKLANIGDDISSKYLESSSVFKKVVTGESFMVQRKYGQPFELESYATQIFCANELPQVSDKTDGFNRRIILIPFNARFTKNDADYDPFIEDKISTDEAMEYLLKIAIEGLKRLLMNKAFTKSESSEQQKKEYKILNNNVLGWLEEEPAIVNQSINDTYLQYQVWCTESGTHPMKKTNVSKIIRKELGLDSIVKRIDGKSVRIYAKK